MASSDQSSAIQEGESMAIDNAEVSAPEKQRLRLLPGSSETAASFALEKEDHTLGNALRYLLTKNPDVEFCGYSIPHPSEAVTNIRIQTWNNVSVFVCLRKALDDLEDLCNVVEDKFMTARDEFNAKYPGRVGPR